MTPARRRVVAALLFGLVPACGPGPAQPKTIKAGDVSLRYDDAVWRAEAGLAPVLMQFDCIAPLCGSDTRAVLLVDPRPFPQAGASAFTPGATSPLLVELRAQSLTPGARLRAEEAVEPVIAGALHGYRGRFRIENRELKASSLVDIMLRHRGAALHLRLTSSNYSEPLGAAFADLANGLSAE